MLQVLEFIFNQIIAFISMLFTINLGNGLNLGLLMCIVFVFLPMMIRIINFLKQDAIDELNDRYEESRPRETLSANKYRKVNGWDVNHSYYESRRLRR